MTDEQRDAILFWLERAVEFQHDANVLRLDADAARAARLGVRVCYKVAAKAAAGVIFRISDTLK